MDTSKYLPIGTVVLLKNATKKLMITGFCTVPEEKPEEMYDYSGCLYPEGIISSKQTCLFNHNQIDKIYHFGFRDEEEQEFKKKMKEALQKEKPGD